MRLTLALIAALEGIVAHARRPGAGGHSPSDFSLATLEQADIDRLEAGGEVADVWALTPMQEGLAFHTLKDHLPGTGGADVYTVQFVLELGGPLQAQRLRRALQALLRRHPNLRAAFVQVSSGATVAVVGRGVTLPLVEVDLSGMAEAEALAEAGRLAEEDHAAGFDLSQAPLLRFTLVRLGPQRHRLVMTNHHILIDGWSVPVLFGELAALYASGGDDAPLGRVTPYRDYLAWLGRQDAPAAEEAWGQALAGAEPTHLAPMNPGRQALIPERVNLDLPSGLTAELADLARRLGVTLNTVVQAAWGVLVGRMSASCDVLFGAVVSGRPAEIPGVESMVGLFIATVPVRVRLAPGESFASLMTRLQAEQSNVMKQGLVGHRLPILQTRSTHAQQIQQSLCEVIFVPQAIGHWKAIFFPGPMEKRDHAMVEDVEKILQAAVFGPHAFQHEFRIAVWKDAERAGQAHEVYRHPR